MSKRVQSESQVHSSDESYQEEEICITPSHAAVMISCDSDLINRYTQKDVTCLDDIYKSIVKSHESDVFEDHPDTGVTTPEEAANMLMEEVYEYMGIDTIEGIINAIDKLEISHRPHFDEIKLIVSNNEYEIEDALMFKPYISILKRCNSNIEHLFVLLHRMWLSEIDIETNCDVNDSERNIINDIIKAIT